MPIRFQSFCLILAICLAINPPHANAQDEQQFQTPPNTQALDVPMTPPADALAMMELPAGFKATMFAAEPDIHQPISICTDAKGRLWVAECYTYSDRHENYNTELNDRIVIFEDTDNDGIFDNKKVFWDKFKKLTSVEVGFGGVWVTAAPNLLFIPDADGDDVPDGEPQILLNGFEGDVIRHNIVNGLRWGPDGWLYGRHGIQATSFVGPPDATESQRVAMNCAIWRYHPQHHKFEIVAQGGTNPWGFDFDEHGEMFMINTVIGHLFHIVPNARYRRMYGAHFNPHIYQVIEQTADHFHWDVSEEHWAVTKKEGMSDGTDLAGGGHAHTGLMIYQGDNWPAEFHNKLFTANFHGRRVNSDSILRAGNSYVAHHGPDYFKTKDPWFRGIEMVYGPDGGVFLLDWSDIGECHENDGIHRTSGRIFKLTYGETKKALPLDLSKLSIAELVELLKHKNEWYVRKARRMLQEPVVRLAATEESARGAEGFSTKAYSNEVAAQLNQAYEATTDTKHKLRIMWARYSCDFDAELFLQARLAEKDEHIRAWAVRLLADGIHDLSEKTAEQFIELAKHDPSGLVRLYIASSLPRFDEPTALKITAALAAHAEDADDRVQPKLIWYGYEPLVTKHVDHAIQLAVETKIPLLRKNIIRRLTTEIESNPAATEKIIAHLNNQDQQIQTDILEGMTQALNGWSHATPPANWPEVSTGLANLDNEKINGLVQNLNLVFGDGRATDELKKIVSDNNRDIPTRRRAIAALAGSSEGPNLFEFLKPHLNNKALTNEVARAFVRCEQPAAANAILKRYRHMDPEGQSIAVNVLVTRSAWAKKLLDAVAKGQIHSSAISASHARQIRNFEDADLNKSLATVWGEIRETSADRMKEVERLRGKLTTDAIAEADIELGHTVYEKSCASCHTLFGKGGKIGPDLTGSDRKNLNYVLENVVDPSASVAQSYQTTVISLEDGRFFTGVVLEENQRTLQLQTKDELLTIDRTTIEQRRQTKNSLMPDGLLDNLSDQEIAGMVRFLTQ